MTLIYNAVFDKNTRKLSFEDKTGNEIYSFTVPERGPAVDDVTKPLTFKATQDGSTVLLYKAGSPDGSFQTSRDGGNTWTDYTLGTAITLNIGEKVSFRTKENRTSGQSYTAYFYFRMTGKIEAWHNVMSLYRTNDFATYNTAMVLLFNHLFDGCTSLTKAPELPATTLADNCYQFMFQGCTSLTEAPELPATTLSRSCYQHMFNGCTSLTKAPALPATTLADYCYQHMFNGCTSLTKAPALPATTLADYCYKNMFYGCSRLNEMRCKIPSSYSSANISSLYASNWLSNVSPTGTFYTNADANWPSGASGIPTGWQRVNEEAPAVDDINKPLTFKSTQDGSTVKLTKSGSPSGDFQMSTDGGMNWVDYTIGDVIRLNTGDEVSFRVKVIRTSAQTSRNYFYFEMTGKIEAWHNVMSLYYTSGFATTNTAGTYAFYSLFYGCTSLTKAPVLSATRLDDSCYAYMFFRCQSLEEAPELPATTLSRGCYSSMFSGCQSLKEVRVSATKTATGALEEWLYDVSATGDFYCDPNATIFPSGASGIPENWRRIPPAVDDITKPLTFKATQDGSTVSLAQNGDVNGEFQTSRDGGNTWTDYTIGTSISLNTDDEVSFRAKADRTSSQTIQNYFKFQMTGKIEAWHNVMSLYRTNDFATYNTTGSMAFYKMFMGCTSLTKAPALPATTLSRSCYSNMFYGCTSLTKAPVLPATTLDANCYTHMFSGCTSLTKAPALPATTLAQFCYDYMFSGCTSLTKAPVLNANTLSESCYYGMFYGCTSLTKAPVLPATTLSESCYTSMFEGCTSLTEAPELPATGLALFCYYGMFSGCTSLTKAPALPATTLGEGCYVSMFSGCTSLTKAPALPATTLGEGCYVSMFEGCSRLNEVRCQMPSTISAENVPTYTDTWLLDVSPTGTFYTNADANWPSGASGIPENWSRVNT